jgi:predicted metal-binding transcription factor (methanogenesis marker protein 9)
LISQACDCGGETDVSFSCPPVQECFVPHYETNNEKNIITGERLENYEK